MTRHGDDPDTNAEHTANHLQAEMNTAAFGAAHATNVIQAETKGQFELIWAELRWHKWLLIALCGGIFGQYVGLGDTVSQAMPFR